ncbi:helix-turn-helix domain-containing protein [Schleiferilactobacillus shenzhenensis]|uniref:HTH cro/C1-type domain-containing protein n=1 Tax=Schleiferilactobacillus shenzhenensis LY-73 TaxID=1231336 RepID=U4TV03_9LACO|nr:helix-turn-helix transcriptional regulator [Schleiferilactobacillus shenzhenensis]ERL65252.1 hypothetical protein L248_2927 [Schleiferilactobacillus shenzhenensis LY-73]
MVMIGQVVRQIRRSKGYTQKEIYTGVVSRSFAIRFEAGGHDMTAEKLFAVLDNLNISVDEFRFIAAGYQETPAVQLRDAVDQAYHAQDFAAVHRLAETAEHSADPAQRHVAGLARLMLGAYDGRLGKPTPVIENYAAYLLTTKQWTLTEIRLAPMLLALYDKPGQNAATAQITARMTASCARYLSPHADPFRVYDALVDYDLVLFQIQLDEYREMAAARRMRATIQAIPEVLLSAEALTARTLILGLWEWYFGDWQKGDAYIAQVQAFLDMRTAAPDRITPAIIRVRRERAQHYRHSGRGEA